MLSTIAVAVLPILVTMLALGAGAKLTTAGSDATPGGLGRLGPAVLVPDRFHKQAMIVCGLAELGLGVGLLTIDHPAARWLPAAFFTVATYVLWDLRRRRPDVGCGCFGDVSATPVGRRSMARAALLATMAATVATAEVTGADLLTGLSWRTAAWLGGGIALLLALSPEIEESVARLRYRAPCEQRTLPPERALARLRSSTAWRAHAPMLESEEPADMWRELCWRFFVFPAREGADAVFAVYLSGRRPAVRVAVVSQDGRPLTSLPESMPVSAGH
ncbi:MauE/DoxX family redox-associated membrane protein [Microbispora sp. NPDC049125]|uniref:MauE/DoxX family redox-associated membrane protein n=1 Tax=Microbispora sp. NPDC049125 TaxID=3154929 RepID=UPI003467BA03